MGAPPNQPGEVVSGGLITASIFKSAEYAAEQQNPELTLIQPRVSIFGTVRRLREQLCYMVKKQSQYVFLYTYMDLWIKNDLENGANPNKILFNFGTS